MKNIIVIILIISFLTNCNRKEEGKYIPATFRNINISQIDGKKIKNIKYNNESIPVNIHIPKVTEPILLSNIVEDIKYVFLETSPDCIIGTINKIKFHNDKIYILDRRKSKSLFVFNDKGKFLYKIGKQGKGPGEYIQLFDFDISNNHIYLFDRGKPSIILFDHNGEFVSEHRQYLNFSRFALLNEFMILDIFNDYNVHIPILKDYKIIKKLLDDNKIEKGLYWNSESGNKFTIKSTKSFEKYTIDTLLYSSYAHNTIYSISNNGITPRYKLSSEYTFFPEELFLKSTIEELFKIKKTNNYILFNGTFFETNNFCFLNFSNSEEGVIHCFYSKDSEKSIVSNILINDYNGLGFGHIIGTINNTFLGYYEPFTLLNKYTLLKKTGTLKPDADIQYQIDNLENTDNHILTFTSIKNFN